MRLGWHYAHSHGMVRTRSCGRACFRMLVRNIEYDSRDVGAKNVRIFVEAWGFGIYSKLVMVDGRRKQVSH